LRDVGDGDGSFAAASATFEARSGLGCIVEAAVLGVVIDGAEGAVGSLRTGLGRVIGVGEAAAAAVVDAALSCGNTGPCPSDIVCRFYIAVSMSLPCQVSIMSHCRHTLTALGRTGGVQAASSLEAGGHTPVLLPAVSLVALPLSAVLLNALTLAATLLGLVVTEAVVGGADVAVALELRNASSRSVTRLARD
jgi:hypothetical protein